MKLLEELLYYTRSERLGTLTFLAIACIALIATNLIEQSLCTDGAGSVRDAANDSIFFAELAAVQREQDSLRWHDYGDKYNHEYVRQQPAVLRPFNPNTADSVMLVSLGLKPWMASNILKYRSRGGRFRKADDFAKVYGLTTNQFDALKPYIEIDEVEASANKELLIAAEQHRDVEPKYAVGTLVPLNSADTTELKKIPGVGSGIAKMIVGYRTSLGGYYAVEQLAEINLKVDMLREWLTVDSVPTRQININKSSIEQMKRHPYINFYQAKAIYDYRKKRGNIHSLNELRLMDEFSEKDMERLSHYVSY
jgi:DNA uptake protein ComE-like DNA-binding protein